MVSPFLVTTALEETWPKDGRPLIFLGEWCRLYSRKKHWSKINAEVLPYHWDDRKKLYSDYQYLQGFYEQMLKTLADKLNDIQNVNHSLRYWRILIGPWLGYFLQILFDRWSSITQALKTYAISETTILEYQPESLISQGMWDFQDYFVSDEWNHFIYGQILNSKENISISYTKHKPFKIGNNFKESSRKRLMRELAGLTAKFLSSIFKEDEVFLKSTYLPYGLKFRLELMLKQIPKFWQPISGPITEPNLGMRQWILESKNNSEFEILASSLIAKFLPTCYLEGYGSLMECSLKSPWPKKPKVIWTSNSHNTDDVFKAWVAEKIESGSKLIIGQHGGHYGIGRWYFLEEHEISIADKYFSWGWTVPEQSKIIPIGQLKQKKPMRVNHFGKNSLLMVCLTMPRYSYHMYSTIMSSQYLNYLDDQFAFVEALPEHIKTKLTVRLYKNDYGWEQKARWHKKLPKIKLDSGVDNINKLIAQNRIFVATYNATTYLESFTLDIPTVIFWNPDHWEIRNSAQPYFDELKEVGIFHDTAESAAKHIVSVWDDVEKWWSSESVSKSVKHFCSRFSNIPENTIKSIYEEIQFNPVD